MLCLCVCRADFQAFISLEAVRSCRRGMREQKDDIVGERRAVNQRAVLLNLFKL